MKEKRGKQNASKKKSNQKNSRKLRIIFIVIMTVLIGTGILWLVSEKDSKAVRVKYLDFYHSSENGEIRTVTIRSDKVEFKKHDDDTLYYTDNPEYEGFKEKLLLAGVDVKNENSAQDVLLFVLDLLYYVIFFGMIAYLIYKLVSTINQSFKVIRHTKTSFDDIAGMEQLKKEMKNTVEIFKNPEKYEQLGIRPTKGIILEGPPGNGKTLFAKALANEAGVNFIATKGADFQSVFMSLGSKKLKMLFSRARKHKPCIIFIDEFDGIGERRNYDGTGVDKENNRIITTMLNEMDGFSGSEGILVIAATNSYHSLDEALIRPGRFDLKYKIPNPDLETRMELIRLYTKSKKLDSGIRIEALANAFEGKSCSAIETILNEAAVTAIANNIERINMECLLEACKKTGIKVKF